MKLSKEEKKSIEEIKEKIKIFDDPDFIFEPVEHVYTYKGKIIHGATTYLQRFTKPFEEDYWSKKKADDRGITQEEVLNEWAEKRDRSCDLGTMVHEYIEDFYEKDRTELTEDNEANERIEKFHKIFKERLEVLIPIVSELRVFDPDWGIAGTLDQLYYYKGSVIIGDWKTNKKIKTDKDYCFGWLKAPFSQHKENELNKYSLQISLYSLILEKVAGIKIDYGFICHIPGKGESKIYKLKDFRKELKQYLDNCTEEEINEEKIKKLTKVSKIW